MGWEGEEKNSGELRAMPGNGCALGSPGGSERGEEGMEYAESGC